LEIDAMQRATNAGVTVITTIAAMVALLSSCRGPETSGFGDSTLMVDLGDEGNEKVAQQVQKFQQTLDGDFVPDNGRKRLMLTGFNAFQGGNRNISGDLVSHMEKQNSPGKIVRRETDGAVISRGEATVNGEIVDVYYIKADTNYASPAMIQAAAAKIKPDRMLSLGQSRATGIETGASNSANTVVAGYQKDGSTSPLMNKSPRVDEIDEALAPTKPTWDPEQLKRDTNFPLSKAARPENNYICNATEYTMQKSLSGQPVQYLPKLKLDPVLKPTSVKQAPTQGQAEAHVKETQASRFAFIHVAPPPSEEARDEYLTDNSKKIMNAFSGSFKNDKPAVAEKTTPPTTVKPMAVPTATSTTSR